MQDQKFALSTQRGPLLNQLETTIRHLSDVGVIGTIWLDGSFVTEKMNPADIDFVLEMASNVYDNGSNELRRVVDSLCEPEADFPPVDCDTNIMFHFPEYQTDTQAIREYWLTRFGFSVNDHAPKGILLIRLEARV